MTHKELVIELSHELSLPRREVHRYLRGLSDVLRRFIVAGHPVHLRSLGRLQRVVVAPRVRPDGKRAAGPASAVSFRAARSLRDDMRRH